MREPVTREVIDRFLTELGKRYRGGGRFYLVGGTQMIYAGFRGQTEDIDYTIQLEGEEEEFVKTVRSLIRDLNVSVEPAGPGDFIPLPSGWRDRSHFVGRFGRLDAYTFDPVSTALSKIERGASRDIEDVLSLLRADAVTVEQLEVAFEDVVGRLDTESVRVDESDFRLKFHALLQLAAGERLE